MKYLYIGFIYGVSVDMISREMDTSLDGLARRSLKFIKAIEDSRPPLISSGLASKIAGLKREFDLLRPLRPDMVCRMAMALKTEYAYHTISLEGNTLSLEETRLVIDYGMTVRNHPLREHLEAANIPKALEYIIELSKKSRKLKADDILALHSIVMRGIDEAEPGRFRSGYVAIAGSKYLPPPAYEVPFLVEQMVEHLNSNPFKLDPVELAFKAHLWLVSIHPFRDGNGRIARLLMGLILLRGGYPPAIIRREHRRRYLSVIEKAQTRLDFKPYYDFMAQELLTTMNAYLIMIRQQSGEDAVVSLAEAAKKYGLDPGYLGLLARRGILPAIKVGNRWHIRVKDLKTYLAKRRLRRINMDGVNNLVKQEVDDQRASQT